MVFIVHSLEMTCSFEIQPRRGGHFWCDSGDVVWRRLGGKVTSKPPEGKESVINVSTPPSDRTGRAFNILEPVEEYKGPKILFSFQLIT